MNTNLKTYKNKNIDYKIIQENKGIIVYECSGLGRKEWYETYKAVFVPASKFKEAEIEAHYRNPKDEDFGTYAWTFNSLEGARKKALELSR